MCKSWQGGLLTVGGDYAPSLLPKSGKDKGGPSKGGFLNDIYFPG